MSRRKKGRKTNILLGIICILLVGVLEIISKVTQEEFMNGKEKQNNENTDA